MTQPARTPSPARERRALDADTAWLDAIPVRVRAELHAFLAARESEVASTTEEAGELFDLARECVDSGKHLRSTFAVLGWLTQAEATSGALRAAAALELLHAFALIQDDVMDSSSHRRSRPATHTVLAARHRTRGRKANHERFGESAAVLLADLLLVWSEQLLRTSGLNSDALDRGWSCFDLMRQELAIGQYLDLFNTGRDDAGLTHALQVARLKSARYTVTRPLLLGALLGGADNAICHALSLYGDALGEAFQMRDDVLGVFGDPAVTGKPVGDDLRDGKVTTLIAVAAEMGNSAETKRLRDLVRASRTDQASMRRVEQLLIDTGAYEQIETMINDRVHTALEAIDTHSLPHRIRAALEAMAHRCVDRND